MVHISPWMAVGARCLRRNFAYAAGSLVLAMSALAASAPTAATAQPAASASAEPSILATDSPEMVCHDTLASFLQKMEPQVFDALSAQTFDRAQTNARIKIFESSSRAQDMQDAYLYYLAKLPPEPKDYADVLSKLAFVLEQRDQDAGLLTLVFEMADYFPATSQPIQQIRIIQSEYLLKVGGPQAALLQLKRLADSPDTVPAVRMMAAGRAGFLQESLGQTDSALKQYHIAGSDLTAGAQGCEALLRATLLELELGRPDDALADIAKLAKAPADILAQSPAAPVVRDLVALAANPDQARAYWAAWPKWQPLWAALLKRLGVAPAPTGQALMAPYIDNYRQLASQAGVAMTQSDASAYFQLDDKLFHAGRWNPGDLGRAMDVLYHGVSLESAFAKDILAFGEAMEKIIPPENKELQKEIIQSRVTVMVDSADTLPAEGRDLAHDAIQKYGADGPSGEALVRLYGFAVLKTGAFAEQGNEAARILAASLADPAAHGAKRATAVTILGEIYAALHRDAEAGTLLETELAHFNDTNDPDGSFRKTLQDELTRLRQRSVQTAGLDVGLAAWWMQNRVPWYDYVNTPPQAGPLSTVDEPAVQVARNFALALNNSASLTVRAAALEAAWEEFPEVQPNGPAVVTTTTAFLARPELPQDLRYLAWQRAVEHLFWSGQRNAAEKLLAAAPAGGATAAEDRADFDLWDQYLAQPNTPAAQHAFADKIATLSVVRRPVLMLALRIVNTLATLNDIDGAKAVFAKLGQAALDPGAQQALSSLQAQFGQMIDTYQAVNPIAEALRKLVLDAAGKEAADAQLPAAWQVLNDQWTPDLSLLTENEVRQGLLTVIRDRVPYGRHPLQVFLDYGEALTFNSEDSALRMKMFDAAQKLAARDDDRFYAALFTSIVDFDDPAVAKHGWEVLAPARGKDFPKAASFVLYYETLMKWRTGQAVDPATAFGPLDAKDLDPFKLRLAVDFYVQHGDKVALQKLFGERPEQDFLQPEVLAGYLRAVQLLGNDDAVKRASEAARNEIAKDVAISWARPDLETAEPVFDLTRALQDPTAYPRAWVSAVISAVRNENGRDLLDMDDGRLQQDWARVLNAANSYLQRNPTSYDAYWRKAEALVKLDRRSEALDPLRVYVKYSKNEDDYNEAAALLKQLEAEAKNAPAK